MSRTVQIVRKVPQHLKHDCLFSIRKHIFSNEPLRGVATTWVGFARVRDEEDEDEDEDFSDDCSDEADSSIGSWANHGRCSPRPR